MGEVRTQLVVLLAGLVGFAVGAAMLGFAALSIGILFLGLVPGGIHGGNWTVLVLFGTLVGLGVGGVVGAKGAVRLAKSWRR